MMLPPWAYAAGAALTVSLSFGAGWQVREWRCEAAVAKQIKAQAKVDAKARDTADKAAERYETGRAAREQASRTATAEIMEIYRDVPIPYECAPAPDALRVLDAALAAAGAHPAKPAPTLPSHRPAP